MGYFLFLHDLAQPMQVLFSYIVVSLICCLYSYLSKPQQKLSEWADRVKEGRKPKVN